MDIDIQFPDNTIVYNKTYSNFKKGQINNPNHRYIEQTSEKKIGETFVSKNGMKATLIAYRNTNDIDVQFEDGVIVKHKTYHNLKRGVIKHPNINCKNMSSMDKRIGETITAKNGMKATIIAYRNNSDIDIQFEDGTIVTNKEYNCFKKRKIGHPTLINHSASVTGTLYHTQIQKIAHNAGNITHYTCYCPICNQEFIMTFEQIKHHTCNTSHPNQKLNPVILS